MTATTAASSAQPTPPKQPSRSTPSTPVVAPRTADGTAGQQAPELLSTVERLAEEHPDAVALRYVRRGLWRGGDAVMTYGRLRERCEAYTRALVYAGLRPGMRVCLMVPPGPHLTALVGALVSIGAVPVLIDPGIARSAVKTCLKEARPEAFVAVPRAHVARMLFGWARQSVRLPVVVGRSGLGTGPTLGQLCAGSAGHPLPMDAGTATDRTARRDTESPARAGGADDVALLAFTSGSTGAPKPVEYRSHHLAAQFGTVRELFALERGEVVMSTLPPFGLAFSALGLCLAIPDVNPRRPVAADPASLVEEIERLGVAGLFASPGPLDRLSRHCAERGIVLTSLRAVACGGASLDPRTTARMRRCLPEEARLTSVYGATEAVPVSRIESRELLGDVRRMSEQGYGSCVGRPLPGNTVRIIGITEEPLPYWSDELLAAPGTVGEITVMGPGISERYPGRPRDTALAKIRDGERTVHRMGDLGRLDEQGRLWFCGRMSQRVRTPYGDLFTEQVEPVANAVPGVRRSALVGVGPPGAQLPVLCVEAELCLRRRRERGRILSELRDRFAAYPHTRRIRRILFHPDLPVDTRHQSKIDRESLARWAAGQLRRGTRP